MTDSIESLQKIPLAETPPIVTTMPQPKTKTSPALTVILAVVIVLSGMGTGFALSQMRTVKGSSGPATDNTPSSTNQIKVGEVYGDKNPANAKDSAEGVLVKGGVSGEGTHHLIRPGGASQNVYLSSSVLDLDLFAGDKVQVKGETFQAQKVGWLIDVGQVTVQELNVASPDEGQPTPVPPAE
jgi:hypothetical protein